MQAASLRSEYLTECARLEHLIQECLDQIAQIKANHAQSAPSIAEIGHGTSQHDHSASHRIRETPSFDRVSEAEHENPKPMTKADSPVAATSGEYVMDPQHSSGGAVFA